MTADPFVILCVEDDPFIRLSFEELLAAAGRRVVCAGDAAGARRALREQRVHLLITDVNLPDGSGLDLAREALQGDPTLPVLLCSGHDVRAAARALGPTVHPMPKPFDLDELEARVARLAQGLA